MIITSSKLVNDPTGVAEMNKHVGTLAAELASFDAEAAAAASKQLFTLVRQDDLAGDLLKIDYSECEVLVHDHLRQKGRGTSFRMLLVGN